MDSTLFPSTSKEVIVLKPVSKLNSMKHFLCTALSEKYDNKNVNILINKAWECMNKTSLYFQLSSIKFMDTCFSSNTLAPFLVSHHVMNSNLCHWIDNGFLENFNRLPNELFAKIFSYLPGDEVQNVQLVCKKFRKIFQAYRSIMHRQEMDCLEMSYTSGTWHVCQPSVSDSINLFSVKKRKQYNGTAPFLLRNYNMFKLRIQLDSINQNVLQNLQSNKIIARRINLHVSFDDAPQNISLITTLVNDLVRNKNIGKIHIYVEGCSSQQENLTNTLNALKKSTSAITIEISTRSRSLSTKFGF